MRKLIIGAVVVMAMIFALIIPGIAADTEPAVVIKSDASCALMGALLDSSTVISNDANGNVKLTCKGTVKNPTGKVIKYYGGPIPDGDGLCGIAFWGTTYDWSAVVTPSGQATFTCFIHPNKP